MGGWSNTSLSMLLEFINELMHPDASLPKDTYEAKKYMGIWVLGTRRYRLVAKVVCCFGGKMKS
jgi:hypothetical protein